MAADALQHESPDAYKCCHKHVTLKGRPQLCMEQRRCSLHITAALEASWAVLLSSLYNNA